MATLKLHNIEQYDYAYIQELAESNGCKIVKTLWQSTRNEHIIYEYEPHNTWEFTLHIKISGKRQDLDFIQYLYNKRNENINFLNRCFALQQEKPWLKMFSYT